MLRTNVYVDGFNLCYGCLKGTPYKWLDLDAMCRRLLPKHELSRIRYFTAIISARPLDPSGPVRQQAYLRALATMPHVSIHLGHFLTSHVRMPLAVPPARGPRTVEVIKTEEKGSDVNLATYLLADAFRQDCEAAVVITNDSDLAEPIRMVRRELRLPVGVVNPGDPHKRSRALLDVTFFKQLRPSILPACQLPVELSDRRGTIRSPTRGEPEKQRPRRSEASHPASEPAGGIRRTLYNATAHSRMP